MQHRGQARQLRRDNCLSYMIEECQGGGYELADITGTAGGEVSNLPCTFADLKKAIDQNTNDQHQFRLRPAQGQGAADDANASRALLDLLGGNTDMPGYVGAVLNGLGLITARGHGFYELVDSEASKSLWAILEGKPDLP